MQSTYWKLSLVVSVLHLALFVTITHLGLQPLELEYLRSYGMSIMA